MDSPFKRGSRYGVRRDFRYLNHAFCAGDVVIFESAAYDAKGGVTRYWFKATDGSSSAWHVVDTGPNASEVWREYFEEKGAV